MYKIFLRKLNNEQHEITKTGRGDESGAGRVDSS
jgi:hypothetical protein